jgi:hypothetical protein
MSPTDPLINASINNFITPNNFRISDYTYYKIDNSLNPIMDTQSELYNNFLNLLKSDNNIPNLDTIISQTTIKRACCKGDASGSFFKIKVKIPYDETYVNNMNINQDLKNQYRELKYAEKEILIPSNLCPRDYSKPTSGIKTACDNFYRLYCENSKLLLQEDINTNFTSELFTLYSPECGCYIDKPQNKINNQPSCYSATCNSRSTSAYIDEETRSKGDCGYTPPPPPFQPPPPPSQPPPPPSQPPPPPSQPPPPPPPPPPPSPLPPPPPSPLPPPPTPAPESESESTILGLSKMTFYIILVIVLVILIIVIIVIIVINKKSNNSFENIKEIKT